jgi:mRNA interferase MazF
MSFDFGDVVIVLFPFTDQTQAKRRPAVVVSNRAYNTARPDIVLMPITSRILAQGDLSSTTLLKWADAGLPKPSALKLVITTFEQSLIIRTIGALASEDVQRLRAALTTILG